MEIKEIEDKSQWETFVLAEMQDTFLQSWNWGEFNKASGEKIWRLGFFENDTLVAVSLIIRINAKRGSFLFVPQGPIISAKLKVKSEKFWKDFFKFLIDLGRQQKVDFIRISPILENTEENLAIFKNAGFRDAPLHMMHPELTWLLDITKTEAEIIKGMRKTQRNLIRRAEKESVRIIRSVDEKYLKAFYDIHMETVSRHKFIPFSYSYVKSEIDSFRADDQISIFSAEYQSKIISSAIIVFYGHEAFYHHGASSSQYSKIPASYLNLWQAIKEAKKRGCKIFNFYGIVEDKPKHPWNGLSKFKQGFGGYKKELLHCQDLPLRKKYVLTCLIEKIRKFKRGY